MIALKLFTMFQIKIHTMAKITNMLLRLSASTNLPVGDVCDLDYATVDGLLCHPSLICASCPGDPGETFCQTRTGGYLSLS